MTTCRRRVAAVVVMACALVPAGWVRAAAAGAASARWRGAKAAPAGLAPPLRPAPSPPPALGGAPCLPFLGCDPIGGLGEEAAGVMAKAVFSTFAGFVADGVKTVLDQVAVGISETTKVKLDRDWLESHANVLRGLAIVVLLPLMLVGLISAIIHRDPHQLVRAGLVYVPVAILGGAAALGLTDTAIRLTDGLTAAVTGDMSGSTAKAMGDLHDAIVKVSSPGTLGLGTFLAIVVLLVLLAGALLIWIELLLRTSAIYVVVLFLPIAMSGLVWRATVSWTRRMIEVLVALILSKFVIVVVIDLAAGMIVADDGIGTILQGATLLLLAACAPFALLRLVPLAEAGMISHLERMERRPLAAATRTTTAAARQVLGHVEAAAGSKAVRGNGGNPLGSFAASPVPGGELNHTDPPEGWESAAIRPRRSAELVGAPDPGGSAASSPAPAASSAPGSDPLTNGSGQGSRDGN